MLNGESYILVRKCVFFLRKNCHHTYVCKNSIHDIGHDMNVVRVSSPIAASEVCPFLIVINCWLQENEL